MLLPWEHGVVTELMHRTWTERLHTADIIHMRANTHAELTNTHLYIVFVNPTSCHHNDRNGLFVKC